MTTLTVGDRVLRRGMGNELVRHGVVTAAVFARPTGTGVPSPMLYTVRWDDTGREERGYLAIGLEQEPLPVGGLGV